MSIHFDLNDLVAFRALADLGSFRKAADSVHLSQPAYSRRIDKLERALGVRLIERTTRRVTLTAAGREFERKVRVLLDDLDNALLGIRGDPGTRGDRVTMACVPSAVQHYVTEVLQRYAESHPRVQVILLDTKANEVLQAVSQGEADFGLTFLDGNDGDVEFAPLFEDRFVLACRHDHPLARARRVKWAQLAQWAFIAVARTSGNRLIVDRALAGTEVRPKVAYEVQTGTTALDLVEAGLGVAAMPRMAISGPEHARLVGVPLVEPKITRTVGLIRRRGRALSASAQHLYALFQQAARQRR
jgi:DNA-binding transcriptional LysR family regulator